MNTKPLRSIIQPPAELEVLHIAPLVVQNKMKKHPDFTEQFSHNLQLLEKFRQGVVEIGTKQGFTIKTD